MKKYIDCDSVILNTEDELNKEYSTFQKNHPECKKKTYIQQMNWNQFLKNTSVINDAIYVLREYNPIDINILTNIHSIDEATAKVCYFREHHISNDIIFVPFHLSATNIVKAQGNILISASDTILQDWKNSGGYPFSLREEENDYIRIETLDEGLDNDKVRKKIKRFFH